MTDDTMPADDAATTPHPTAPAFASFTTERIPHRERIEFWEAHNTNALIGLDIRTLDDSPLRAEERNLHLPTLRFAHVRGSPQVVERSQSTITANPTEDVALFLCLDGESFFHSDQGTHVLHRGQALLCDADSPFLRGFSVGVHELVLTLPKSTFTQISRGADLRQPRTVNFSASAAQGSPECQSALEMARLILGAFKRPDLDSQTAEDLTVELMERTLHGAGPDYRSTHERALRVIDHHLADPNLNRAQTARAVGVSERQLSRIFADQGTTFSETVTRQRIHHSQKLMEKQPQLSISEVGLRSGFPSASHFSRTFREHTGLSPREARAAAQP